MDRLGQQDRRRKTQQRGRTLWTSDVRPSLSVMDDADGVEAMRNFYENFRRQKQSPELMQTESGRVNGSDLVRTCFQKIEGGRSYATPG